MFTIPMFSGKTMDDIGYKSLVFDIVRLLRGFSPIVFFVLGTFFIQDLEGRQQRINELILPATNLEKFVARVLLVAVIYPISYLCIFYCCRRITAVDFNDYCTRRKDVYGCSLLWYWYVCKCRLTPMDQGFVDTYDLFNCYLWRFTLPQVSLAEVDSYLFCSEYSFSYRFFLS